MAKLADVIGRAEAYMVVVVCYCVGEQRDADAEEVAVPDRFR
jgi:hypothetical protein